MPDNYETYYGDKLWRLLPAVYHFEDSDSLDRSGPLREMVNRIGAQAAIVRRSLDRLWDDQSIESCDDWVIAYVADLLATNLVAGLDARGQRLDVAKTIYYRRRKGTVAMLEELAADVTGWNARVVEFFRRLGRTRHGLDPELGDPAAGNDLTGVRALQLAQGLVGPLTGTMIGGLADLRNRYGAIQAHSAFDDLYHSVDVRRGQEQLGRYNIPRLGIFLWRLYSFGTAQTTPVAVRDHPGHYTFDPTGRERPLFAAEVRAYGDERRPPAEWQLPTPISTPLWEREVEQLYASATNLNALGVFHQQGSSFDLVPPDQLTIYPECGRLKLAPTLHGHALRVTYHYGFPAQIGAGPFRRRRNGGQPPALPQPETPVSGGGNALVAPLTALGAAGTITLADSLTYSMVANLGGATPIQHVVLRSDAEVAARPVVRLPATPGAAWVFEGATGANLALEGLLISGGDIVLRGDFASIALRHCTLDPGDAGVAPNALRHCTLDPGDAGVALNLFGKAADGRDLRPCQLWIEGQVQSLSVERSITGPIRTRNNGAVKQLSITDSIVQALRTADFGPFVVADLKDPTRLAAKLRDRADPLSAFIHTQLPPATVAALAGYDSAAPPAASLQADLVNALNALLAGPSPHDPAHFARVQLSPATQELLAQNPTGKALVRLNRLLLEEGFPLELADLALGTAAGAMDLVRCTVMGPACIHRLEASECIFDERVLVGDTQHGCLRFSAWSSGSLLPRQYESVEVAPRSPIFTSRTYAQPGYGQLLSNADRAILAGAAGASILAGAQNGAEMGATAGEKTAIKARSLRIKLEEFMPIGLAPVLIYVT
jgi:hypothetical protein